MSCTGKRIVPIPVIMLTGRSDSETIQRCAQLGTHSVQKAPGAWDRLKSIDCDLLDIESTECDDAQRYQQHTPNELHSI